MIHLQSKAEAMGPAKLTKEMRPKGKARPTLRRGSRLPRVAPISTCSNDDPSKSAYDARIAAMRAALADVAGADSVVLDFYGADKIARWS